MKESAEEMQKALSELRGKDRSEGVQCEHDGGRQSQGGCLCFHKLESAVAGGFFSAEKNKQKKDGRPKQGGSVLCVR